MEHAGVSDLDVLVVRCTSKRARSFLSEAVTCFKGGAFRASIVATWVAVVFDYLAKLEQLALSSDGKAQKRLDEFKEISRKGDIGGALKFERGILASAKDEFQFLGPIAHDDLVRLQEDRNRCAHPSMIDSETDYQPAPEAARLHIVNAVRHLLEHGPAQGTAAIVRLYEELDSQFFPNTIDELVLHMKAGALGRPRASLVRNYVLVLLKDLLQKPAPAVDKVEDLWLGEYAQDRHRERVLLSLEAVLALHRAAAHELLAEKFDDLVTRCQDAELGTVVIVTHRARELWLILREAQQARIKRYTRQMPAKDLRRILPIAARMDVLAADANNRFESAHGTEWTKLGGCIEPPQQWVDAAIEKMCTAEEWKTANDIGKDFLIPQSARISDDNIRRLFRAARVNQQLKSSWGFGDLLKELASVEGRGRRISALATEEGAQELVSTFPWWPRDIDA
jgi:hypothetical protein